MEYTYLLRTSGVSPAGAEQALLGETPTNPVDRSRMAALSWRARSQAFAAVDTEAAAAAKLAHTGPSSYTQGMADARAAAQAERAALLAKERDRIEREIEYWTNELAKAQSRLKTLFSRRAMAQKAGTLTPAQTSTYAEQIRAAEEEIARIEEQLDRLKTQKEQVDAQLSQIAGSALQTRLAGGRTSVSGRVQQPLESTTANRIASPSQPTMHDRRRASVLAELEQLKHEIAELKKQIEACIAELTTPPDAIPGETQLERMEREKARQARLREWLAYLRGKLADLEARYLELLAQL